MTGSTVVCVRARVCVCVRTMTHTRARMCCLRSVRVCVRACLYSNYCIEITVIITLKMDPYNPRWAACRPLT